MTLRVIGVGLGRTGTHSLKIALERLLDGPCYHMVDVYGNPEHIDVWHRAAKGDLPDWATVFAGCKATVDWPGAAFWRELCAAYPDALVILSVRDDADAWWRSADRTIFEVIRRDPSSTPWLAMWSDLAGLRFCEGWRDERSAIAAYERHNDEVRSTVPPDRLVEWRPGDGWEPIATALGVAVPDEPFPHVNTAEEFRLRSRLNRRSKPGPVPPT